MNKESLENIGASFHAELAKASSAKDIEALRIKYLGRKAGILTTHLRSLGGLSPEEKREFGPITNALRAEIEEALEDAEGKTQTTREHVDITMPAIPARLPSLHPLTIIESRIRSIFARLGFAAIDGPELETEYYAFESLNIPKEHPARDMWDTFWIKNPGQGGVHATASGKERLLLRPHTSPVQVRYMETHAPPIRIIVPGRTFRHEATDASHEANFHQVEGLFVDTHVSVANLKHTLTYFLKELFGADTKLRLRPSFFPFVEPGLEVDINWRGEWLEVAGAGMVHQRVFKAVKYPPKMQGFAFGAGLDRLAMIAYDIPDIRLLYSGDIRLTERL